MMTVARSHGFKAMVAASGSRGLELANQYQPSAIGLDINLSDMSGWTVLDQLKRNSAVRHVPIYVLSVADEERSRALQQGAFGFTAKPLTQEAVSHAFDEIERYLRSNERAILIIQDHPAECQKIEQILSNTGATIHTAGNGAQALALLKTVPFDCLVLDLVLPDMSGFALIDEILKLSLEHCPPVLVYTARDLTREEDLRLRNAPKSFVIKGIHSLDRLLDEVTLFMHTPESRLPQEQQQMLLKIRQLDPVLSGKTVMIVDDDIRNIFAITAALERYGAQTIPAENGKDAISRLKQGPPVDAVLMDIMMPEMDGYATMRVIRTLPTLATLPVIALTAKAMKGDRDKCIEAGASDYITKPVNMEQLLSLLRVWMEGLETIGALREKLMNDPNCMTRLIQTLSVNVTEMFRDPAFYRVFRNTVLPSLQALPFIRIWHAGGASGEEAYSMAILLMEEGLLSRARIYSTDINDIALQQARDGQYSLERMIEYNENYINAGCKRALTDYYKIQGDQAILHDDLKMKIVWAQHNLVTDASFNEFHVIICRNVLIYFDRTLQTRVHSLFYNSLIQLGWLGLGRKETLKFTAFETRYTEVDEREKWFRKV